MPMIDIWSLEGTVGLEFSDIGWEDSFFTFTASLIVDGDRSSVRVWMIAPHANLMLAYLDDVAGGVDGWPGAKAWDSEHHELTLSCEDMNPEQICGVATLRWEPPNEATRVAPFIWWRRDVRRIAAHLAARIRQP
jgi:hypothetical protein